MSSSVCNTGNTAYDASCLAGQGFFSGALSKIDLKSTISAIGENLTGIGTGIAGGFSKEFSSFFGALNLDDSGLKAGEALTKGTTQFYKGVDSAKLAQEGAAEVRTAFDAAAPIFEQMGTDSIAAGGRLQWSALRTYLPGTVLGLACAAGVPLIAQYIYKVAEHKITRPKLLSESRYLDWTSRIWDVITGKTIQLGAKAIFNPELTAIIDDITESTKNLQNNNGFFQNVLLYGPGGTGKTMIAEMMARNSNMNYEMMSGGNLAQHIQRKEHVTELNKLMERVKKSKYPTILFIDEAESLALRRDLMQSQEHRELLNAFLHHTGEASKKLMIVMATNRLEDIDEAVLTRMDHKLHIAPPAAAERKTILQQYIGQFFTVEEQKTLFTDAKIQEISNKTEGFTGRILFKMLNAISGKKCASKDNKLTTSMIDLVVNNFVNQEKRASDMHAGVKPTEKPIELSTLKQSSRVSNIAKTPMRRLGLVRH